MPTTTLRLIALASTLTVLGAIPGTARAELSKGKTMQIAEEAFIYGFPMVMNYAVFHEYFVDKTSPGYKAPINQLYNTARVYTPQDTAIVTPNSDTPYSFVGMDLRAEPFVLCNPEIDKSRYFSLQLIDMYTFNYGYAGSRTTGNGAACHMIVGPAWKGQKPEGISTMFRSETDFSIAVIRTQLFDPADIENVVKIQAGYRGQTLSQFQKKAAPPAAPPIKWPKIDKKLAAADPFAYLNFVLQFCPATGPAAVETPLRARFAEIGVEAGKPFPVDSLTPQQKTELETAIKSGLEKIKQHVAGLGKEENGWRIATDGFGDRKAYAGNWTLRAAAAMAGIYGNDAVEALYPLLATDSDGNKPDCSTNRYTLTFSAGQLPPANAFWSVTMYDGKTQLLVANPINRYLINSPMLPHLKKNPDGSLTIYISKDPPGTAKESNWLPAPNGPIYLVMRLYWPKEAALNGSWKPPAVQRITSAGGQQEGSAMKFASDEVAAAARNPVVAEALAARGKLDEAFAAQDIDAVSEVCAKDLIVNTPANRVARLETVLGFFKAGRMNYESAETTIEALDARADQVVIMGEEVVKPRNTAPNAGKTVRRRFTDVWRKEQDGKWRLTIRQATITSVD